MPPRGRLPIPTDRKLLSLPTGHSVRDTRSVTQRNAVPGRQGQKLPDSEPVPTIKPGHVPTTPKALPVGKPGRRYWHIYWKFASAWLASADYPVVLRLCVLHDLASDIYKQMHEDGLFKESEHTGNRYVNGLLSDYLKTIAQIERLESLLGLTPVDRARIRVAPKNEESGLDAWRQARKSGS